MATTIAFPANRKAVVIPWDARPRRRFAPIHLHDGEEWILLRRGRLRLLCADQPLDLKPGDLLHLPAGRKHAVLEASSDCRKWVVWSAAATGGATGGPPVRHLAVRDLRDLEQCCRLADAHQHEDAVGDLLAQTAATLAAYFWRRAEVGLPVEAVHPAVATACRILRERGGAASLDVVAAQAGMSRSRLSHLFTVQTGVRLVEYRTRCRLERFVQLQGEHPRMTLAGLARHCGFTSYMQFYRMHRRLLGRAPRG
jgi:AraC-like DNA-binding protein